MGKGSQKSTSTYRPDSQAYQLYSDLLNRATDVANTPYQAFTGELVAPMNAQQNMGIANLNQATGYAQPYLETALGLAQNASQPLTANDIQRYMSPYTQQVVDATQNQFNNQNAQAQNSLKGNAASMGALGGDRVAVSQAILANQQQLAQAPTIANLYNQGYTTALNTALAQQQMQQAGAANLGGLALAGQNAALTGSQAQIDAGAIAQRTQQANDAAAYDQFLQQQAYPFQTTQWLAGLGTGVGSQMGGTNTTKTDSGGNAISQALGGISSLGGMLGSSGAFGTGGWMTALLARGGRANGYASGGGIPSGGVANLPETNDTLYAQQGQLLDGDRMSQMFPNGTGELPLPDGMGRTETPKGVFHYNPRQVDADAIQQLSSQGRENELLGLGDTSKAEVLQRLGKGEVPIVIVERTPEGVEVRAAAGTMATAPQQMLAMSRHKSPGNSVSIEPLPGVIADRLSNRAAGGGVSGGSGGGLPFGGGSGWVPFINLQPVSTRPPDPKSPQQQQLQDMTSQIKGFSDLGKGLKDTYNALTWDGGTPLPGGLPIGMGGIGHMAAGGAVEPNFGLVPRDYACGGRGPSGAFTSFQKPEGFASGGEVDGGLTVIPKDDSFDDRFNGVGGTFDDRFTGMKTVPEPKVLPLGVGNVPELAGQAAYAPSEGFASPAEGAPVQGGSNTPPTLENVPAAAATAPETSLGVVPRARPDIAGMPGQAYTRSALSVPGNNSIRQEVFAAAERNGIPPELAMRLINQESGFKQGIVSPAGAIGLAQLMPGTARDLGVDPHNAIENINGGMRYLRQMYDKYGNWETALAAYNAGPGRVDSVLAGKSMLPQETKNYVASITGSGVGPTQVAENGPTEELAARSKGVAPSQQTGIDWGPNSKLWPALTMAGAAMLASRSPNFGPALGEGLAAGMNTYAQLKGTEAEQRMNQQKMDLAAKKLSQDADHWEKDYALKQMPYNGGMTTADKLRQATEDRKTAIEIAKQKEAIRQHNLAIRTPMKYQLPSGAEGFLIPRVSPDGNTVQYYQYNPATGETSKAPIGGSDFTQPDAKSPFNAPAPGVPQTQAPAQGGAQLIPAAAEENSGGIVGENNKLVKAGNYDYSQDAPYIEKGLDVPEPAATAGKSVGSLKTDAEMYLQTGKLPPVRGGRSPVAIAQQNYQNAVKNYGNALAASRGMSPVEVAEAWRSAPGMLRFIMGADGRATVALGTATRHLDTVRELAQAWAAHDNQTLNRIKAAWSREFGSELGTNLEAAGKIVGPEIIKALGVAGAGTSDERANAEKLLSTASSPKQLIGAVETIQKLLGGQLEGKMRQAAASGVSAEKFKSLIGERPFEILSKADHLGQNRGASTPAAAKVPVAERFKQLIQSGVPEAEAYKRLKSEGY